MNWYRKVTCAAVFASSITLFSPLCLHGAERTGGPLMEPVVIHDPVAAGEGRQAITLLKPAGWKVEGGIVWRLNRAWQASPELRLYDPNTVEQIQILPMWGYYWHPRPLVPLYLGQNYLGYEVQAPVIVPKTYILKYILPAVRRGVDFRVIEYQEQREVVGALTGGQALPEGSYLRAGRLRIAYTHKGKAVEEDFTVVLGGIRDNFFMPGQMLWGATYAYAFRAERGQLDTRTQQFHAVIASARLNPEWARQHTEVVRFFQRRMQVGIDSAVQISIMTRETSQQIAKLYDRAYRNRQEAQDRSSFRYSQYLRGTERYYNPLQRESIDLPANYKYVWVNEAGQYLLTDNVLLDPNVTTGRTWKQLRRTNY